MDENKKRELEMTICELVYSPVLSKKQIVNELMQAFEYYCESKKDEKTQ